MTLSTSTYNEHVKADKGKILMTRAQEVSLVIGDDDGPFTKGPDAHDKWVLLVGDGLSLQNFWNFLPTLNLQIFSFAMFHQQSKVFKCMLSHFIPVPGNFHVTFHVLDSIYHIFLWRLPSAISNCIRMEMNQRELCGKIIPTVLQLGVLSSLLR